MSTATAQVVTGPATPTTATPPAVPPATPQAPPLADPPAGRLAAPVGETVQARPRIVVLCGSTRFRAAFAVVNRTLTLQGAIVLAPGVYGHADGVQPDDLVKAGLDHLHLRKIDLADEVVVVAPGGYLGASTRAEIAYAEHAGKPVTVLQDQGEDLPADAGEVLRVWGSHLCQGCGTTSARPGSCCQQPMVPVQARLHRKPA